MAISSGLAPTTDADCAAQSAAMSCQDLSGELSHEVKWPWTPMDAHVSSWALM